MIELAVKLGDLFDETADAIICPANPWLNLSGGVNGEILRRGGQAIQNELHAYLRAQGKSALAPGAIVVTTPGPFESKHLLHAVAIDPFYDSNPAMVQRTVELALTIASGLGATTVAMAALATGYGRLSIEEFGEGLLGAIQTAPPSIGRLTVVLRKDEDVEKVQRLLKYRPVDNDP